MSDHSKARRFTELVRDHWAPCNRGDVLYFCGKTPIGYLFYDMQYIISDEYRAMFDGSSVSFSDIPKSQPQI